MISRRKSLFIFSVVLAMGCVLLLNEPSSRFAMNGHPDKLLHNQKPSFLKSPNVCIRNNKTSVFYIKIQKTGSTTIKSMLLNYALKNGKTICMDNMDLYHMNFPYPIDESKLTKLYNGKCQVVADELIFDKHKGNIIFHI